MPLLQSKHHAHRPSCRCLPSAPASTTVVASLRQVRPPSRPRSRMDEPRRPAMELDAEVASVFGSPLGQAPARADRSQEGSSEQVPEPRRQGTEAGPSQEGALIKTQAFLIRFLHNAASTRAICGLPRMPKACQTEISCPRTDPRPETLNPIDPNNLGRGKILATRNPAPPNLPTSNSNSKFHAFNPIHPKP